ncbi:MAG: PRC-barrel domain-containing protein [Endomicrobiales bacterium]
MLRRANELKNYTPEATDGAIGHVDDLYFDDETWTVRYLVVHTGSWLTGRMVLISPIAVKGVDPEKKLIALTLTKEKIEKSPPVDTHIPVSRRYEAEYFSYYKWPRYWGSLGRWGSWPAPSILAIPGIDWEEEPPKDAREESRLRSAEEVESYSVKALDGKIGSVKDFLIDDKTWALRYLEADTRTWLPGKRVLLPSRLVHGIHWDSKEVSFDVTREMIRSAPSYDPLLPVTRDYEAAVLRHYRPVKARREEKARR